MKTNCVFENTPPPHFGLHVHAVYKMGGGGGGGGVLMGHYGMVLTFYNLDLLAEEPELAITVHPSS